MAGVDVGGTFTDVVAIENGRLRTAKVPTDKDDVTGSVLQGAELIDIASMAAFNHGSTHGLNAIITRGIPKIGYLATEGHRDILDRGLMHRPFEALTDASWRRPFGDAAAPLVPRYLRRGVRERMMADGSILIPLDEEQARREIQLLKRCRVEGVAICLMNAYVNAAHEERLRELAQDELGDIPCSISSSVSPLAREYVRSSTTVIDVLMKLMYGDYTARLAGGLQELGFRGSLNYADCAAMLEPADYAMEHPHRVVFGGPAAGTVASAHFGRAIGDANLVCADVGGTSCDISLITEGKPWVNTTFELEFDLIVNSLSTEISSLGAGGGSIVSITPTGEVQVGPDSAGGQPGPACYGLGGTRPTLTDACLLMGILDADRFLDGKMKLEPDLARAAFESLDTRLSLDQRVRFAWTIGLNNVAEGIVEIGTRHGIDPRDYSLVAFGAAGPMILPSLIEHAHVRRVIVPPHPGLFSALGMLSSDLVYSDSRSAYTLLTPEAAPAIAQIFKGMEERLLPRLNGSRASARVVRSFDARLAGQTWDIPMLEMPPGEISAASVEAMTRRFHDEYQRRYGNRFEMIPVQGVTYRVQVFAPSEKLAFDALPPRAGGGPESHRSVMLRHLYEGGTSAAEYERAELLAGDVLAGPAVIREPMSTTFVPPRHRATVGGHGELVIEQEATTGG